MRTDHLAFGIGRASAPHIRFLPLVTVFALNIEDLGMPLQCFSLTTYTTKLLFYMIGPLVVELVVLIAFVVRAICAGRHLTVLPLPMP